MTVELRPSWWRCEGDIPPEWTCAFQRLTCDDGVETYGLAAGIFIARTRKKTGRGPTFSELFDYLSASDAGLVLAWPESAPRAARYTTMHAFRHLVAIHWKRKGWIDFDRGVERSLRTGRTFRARSRERQRFRGDRA